MSFFRLAVIMGSSLQCAGFRCGDAEVQERHNSYLPTAGMAPMPCRLDFLPDDISAQRGLLTVHLRKQSARGHWLHLQDFPAHPHSVPHLPQTLLTPTSRGHLLQSTCSFPKPCFPLFWLNFSPLLSSPTTFRFACVSFASPTLEGSCTKIGPVPAFSF